MGGQKFQYDESGGTFFYFILSFLALILIPSTFYLWPRKKKEDPNKPKADCQCPPCIKKRIHLTNAEPYKGLKSFLTKLALIGGWALLIFLAYKVSQFDYEMSNFDPYEILGVGTGSTEAEIKRSYRKLSVIYHPDKETGDAKEFMRITKAYKALTDEEAKKNWDKYGNPDGPGAMSFGIALPSWIVEKENSVWVLGLYALVFMVALPTAVGTWWYRSIRFSGDKVLLDTTQMYLYFLHKTPQMAIKRAIMILAASLEFNKQHNSQVVERLSDNEEVPLLIKQFSNLNEKCKELPLCRLYSIKARAIIYAHLDRMTLNADTLEKDRQFIVRKCPYLIQEMVSCVNQLIMLAYAGRINRLPTIDTIENCMKMSPMIIQGLWEHARPLLQLPYLTEDHTKYFITKKRHIKNLQQLAQLPAEESRAILRNFSDYEYENLMRVLGRMPLIDFSFHVEVIDDEHTNVVTAGAIVTVTVSLTRRNMKELFGDTTAVEKTGIKEDEEEQNYEQAVNTEAGDGSAAAAAAAQAPKKPSWLKQQPKKAHKGGKKKATKSNLATAPATKKESLAATTTTAAVTNDGSENESDGGESDVELIQATGTPAAAAKAAAAAATEKDSSEDEKKVSSVEDDDVEWEKFQKKLNKREKLEGKSKVSHPVHAPYFPDEKQEYWWTYICDRKSRTLLTAPFYVTSLVDHEDVQLKFTAPRWPGMYTFTVCLRSDSYIGMDQSLDLKLDVKEVAAIPAEQPEYGLSDSEEEQQDQLEHESEFTTDSSEDEDEKGGN